MRVDSSVEAQRAITFRPRFKGSVVANNQDGDLCGLRKALRGATDPVDERRAMSLRRDDDEPRLLLFGKSNQGVADRSVEDCVMHTSACVLNTGSKANTFFCQSFLGRRLERLLRSRVERPRGWVEHMHEPQLRGLEPRHERCGHGHR